MRPLLVTVIGKSARDPNDPVAPRALAAAEEVGRLLAERGAVVVSGGLSGVMEAVSRGAKSANGLVIDGNLVAPRIDHHRQCEDDLSVHSDAPLRNHLLHMPPRSNPSGGEKCARDHAIRLPGSVEI